MQKKTKRFIRLPSTEEVDKLIEATMISDTYSDDKKGMFKRWRDRTLLIIYFYGGLRPSEALKLKWEDIDFTHREIKIKPEHNKERNGLSASLTKPVERALLFFKDRICPSLNIKFDYIFPSMDTLEPMGTDSWCRTMRQLAKEIGILKIEWRTVDGQPKYNIKTYTGRKWFANQIWESGKEVTDVQHLLRQQSWRSTLNYIVISQKRKNMIADQVFT